MRSSLKVAGYLVLLAVVFTVAYVVGANVPPMEF